MKCPSCGSGDPYIIRTNRYGHYCSNHFHFVPADPKDAPNPWPRAKPMHTKVNKPLVERVQERTTMNKDTYLKTVAAVVGVVAIYVTNQDVVQAVEAIATAAAVFFFPK